MSSSQAAQRNLASISPFFIVKDLQVSIAHYIERFGFTLDFQGPPDLARVGSLGCSHLHPGPRHAVRRVQAAGGVVREGVVVHR